MLEEFVRASLHEGADLGEILDGLLAAAGDMGLSGTEALDVIERVAASVRASDTAGVQLWYDGEKAATGIAMGSTLLQFRVRNTQARPIHSVAISVVQPLTGELIDCPVINILNKDGAKSTEVTMVLEQVGRHIVREGFVRVRPLAGATQHLRFDESILITAESVNAARTQIHSISQTIQTHGGGVVSADGIAAPSTPRADPWLPIRLVPCSVDDVERIAVRGSARSLGLPVVSEPASVPEVSPPPAPPPPPVPAVPPPAAPLTSSPAPTLLMQQPEPANPGLSRAPVIASPTAQVAPTAMASPSVTGASLQQQLAVAILAVYPDSVVKKIDQDNYLDIHIPSVFPRRGTHLFFNTTRGTIGVGVHCRTEEFVARVLEMATTVERWRSGLVPVGNPKFTDAEDAVRTARKILADIAAAASVS